MSKFMFHLKFSEKENYVHEHELYEVMRSRNLYQVQFEVRSNYKKRMRNLEISEKAHVNGFQNSRNIFIQKMKERMEQAETVRAKTSLLAQKSFARIAPKDVRKIRRYVTLPPTPTTRPDFPNLIQKMATPVEQPLPEISPSIISSGTRSRRGTGTTRRMSSSAQSSSFLANAPSPSMAATMYIDDTPMARREREREMNRNKAFLTSKVVVAGKNDTTTHFIKPHDIPGDDTCHYKSSNCSSGSEDKSEKLSAEKVSEASRAMMPELPDIQKTLYEQHKLIETIPEYPNMYKNKKESLDTVNLKTQDMLLPNSRLQSEKKDEKHLTSSVHFPDNLTSSENLDSENASQKCVEWATAHKLLNKSSKEIEEEKTFRRLLIDRPSKWAFSHIHGDVISDSNFLDMKFPVPHSQNFDVDKRLKSGQVDISPEKLIMKPKATVSLPVIDIKKKPIVNMEPGGLTPDGRLILTQGDYDEYLSGYRKARNMRLNLAKKRNKSLSKMVENFRVSSKLQLKDDTSIFSVQSEC